MEGKASARDSSFGIWLRWQIHLQHRSQGPSYSILSHSRGRVGSWEQGWFTWSIDLTKLNFDVSLLKHAGSAAVSLETNSIK